VSGFIAQLVKPGSHMPPKYLRFSRRLRLTMLGDLFSGSLVSFTAARAEVRQRSLSPRGRGDEERCVTPARAAAKTNGSPAHLRWITVILKLGRNANRIGAIFNSFISNLNQMVLLECQFSLAFVLVMRYVRRKMKLEKMRTRRKYWGRPMLKGRTNHDQDHTLFTGLRLHNREYFFWYREFLLYDFNH